MLTFSPPKARALALAGASLAALAGCKSAPAETEQPIVTRDYDTPGKPVIARGKNADTDGPALALTAHGDLHRVGLKVERVTKGVRCLGAAGAEAKVVTDEGIVRVGLDAVTPDGPAIPGVLHCGVGADGSVVAITAAGIVKADAGGQTALPALPPHGDLLAIASDGDGVVWVIDAGRIHALKNGAWKSTHNQAASGSLAELRDLDVAADGTLVLTNKYRDFALIAKGKSRGVTLYGGLSHLIPDAIGSGADGTVWAGNYKYIARSHGEAERSWERVALGYHGQKPTAITGDGRGRGWIANDLVLAVVSSDGQLLGEMGRDAFGDDAIERLLVVGAGPPSVSAAPLATWTGKVRGHVRVRDEVVPGAHVLLCAAKTFGDSCEGAKTAFAAVTDDDGAYTLDGVPPLDMRSTIEAGTQRFLPMSAQCCGYMTKGTPYQLDFDLGDSIGEDMKPSCPKADAKGHAPPCKLRGVVSHPPRTR